MRSTIATAHEVQSSSERHRASVGRWPDALSLDGYRIGIVARRTDLLAQLRAELTGPCVIKTLDVSQPEPA